MKYFSFAWFPILKNLNSILSSLTVPRQIAGWIRPVGYSLSTWSSLIKNKCARTSFPSFLREASVLYTLFQTLIFSLYDVS